MIFLFKHEKVVENVYFKQKKGVNIKKMAQEEKGRKNIMPR